MLRMTVFVRRRQDLTREAFLEHWRTRHGPLIAGTPELARHIHRYEQHAVSPAVPEWAGTPGFDGVAVQWFRSFADFEGFLAEPAYAELIAPDEERFLDRSTIIWQFTEDPVVMIDGPVDEARAAGSGP